MQLVLIDMKNILFILILLIYFSSNAWAVDVTLGTEFEIDGSDTEMFNIQEISTDKFVTCWSDAGPGKCKVATVSGTTPTFGDENEFNADILVGATAHAVMGVAKVVTDRFAVFFVSDAADDDGFTNAGTVTTTTIDNYGTELEFDTSDIEEAVGAGNIADNKSVLTYNDELDSQTCKSVVCTNDTTPDQTCGTPLECDSGTDFWPQATDTIKLATDKWVSCFSANDDGDDGYCVVGTASTTTITYDVSPSEFLEGTIVHIGVCSPSRYGGTDNRFVVVYDDSGNTEATAGTVSTRTITYGTALTSIDSTTDANAQRCTFVTETKFLVGWADKTNSTGTMRLLTVNWATRAITAADADEEDFLAAMLGNNFERYLVDITVLSDFDGTTPKVAIAYVKEAGDFLFGVIGDLSFAVAGTTTVIQGDVVIQGDMVIQ